MATVYYINSDKLYDLVNAEGWESKNPVVRAYSDLQFPREEEGRTLADAVRTMKENGMYEPVAVIEPSTQGDLNHQLESMYTSTQNIFDSWQKGEAVVEVLNSDWGRRSSMMGDMFELYGEYYVVARFGMEKVA